MAFLQHYLTSYEYDVVSVISPSPGLRGTVVSPPVVIVSAQFLLQDERGSVVFVSVYKAGAYTRPLPSSTCAVLGH